MCLKHWLRLILKKQIGRLNDLNSTGDLHLDRTGETLLLHACPTI
jgi:hypothetical protein